MAPRSLLTKPLQRAYFSTRPSRPLFVRGGAPAPAGGAPEIPRDVANDRFKIYGKSRASDPGSVSPGDDNWKPVVAAVWVGCALATVYYVYNQKDKQTIDIFKW
eukprot:CAMPEP_0177634822 /NCGR_PEP_ID=MMETSP0447-20121125/3569_1 /TAXON_ID=0 /ORGANISM="Stygamoeba regulata, Strain BSH-02190019" /LENGTH=103 /DNA_ID=CAMNT_0019136561 /DNA_START=40 /DNA_END=348 /DNA_ORIENTATION=+